MTRSSRTAVTRLSLSDFRNYEILDQRFGDRSVVLYGANGAGKTNLLEAISLLGPGRGLRRTVFTDLARNHGAGGWAVAAEAIGATGTVRLGTGLVASSAASPDSGAATANLRQCRIDG
ncbi:MAG: AAA family ATPase, partial [Hyphomicrobiales bacterium]